MLFDKFDVLDSGLGLILTKEFIENKEGELLVKSSPGKGSVFWFELDLMNHYFSLYFIILFFYRLRVS